MHKDAEIFYALDPDAKKTVWLSGGSAEVFVVSGMPRFIIVSQERYVPLDERRTVNCTHLDWWDSRLKRTRFSRPLSLFGGACIFIAGTSPVTISGPMDWGW